MVTVGGSIGIVEHAAIEEQMTEILLLDNAYRGVGTHLVGREGRWSNAVDMFKQSPLFGAGAVFKTGEVASPHNFWLYAFVEFGA
ncbi:MAG TPA: hypothetical protein VFT56_02470, partial [Sphingomonas sp.]|nr:hypothetical protein [Sphingomonas sp.]